MKQIYTQINNDYNDNEKFTDQSKEEMDCRVHV